MDDLIAFLNARHTEDLALIDAAEAEVGTERAGEPYSDGSGTLDRDAFPSYPWGAQPAELAFMARWHPRTVRGDIEAKQRLARVHTSRGAWFGRDWDVKWPEACHGCGYDEEGPVEPDAEKCATARLLALPFAGHPDYRPEWRL